MKNYFYDDVITPEVKTTEAAALFHFAATLEPKQTRYLYEQNQFIFDELDHFMKDGSGKRFHVSIIQFVKHLFEIGKLEKAGGLSYLQKIFNGLEPAEVDFI